VKTLLAGSGDGPLALRSCHSRSSTPSRLRQEDLAGKAGLSRSVAGRIERREIQRITWADLVALVEALDARLELDLR
jgi:helix-turn-helix protein